MSPAGPSTSQLPSSQASIANRQTNDPLCSSPLHAAPSTPATSASASSCCMDDGDDDESEGQGDEEERLQGVGRSLFALGWPASPLDTSPLPSASSSRSPQTRASTARTPPSPPTHSFLVKGTVTPSRAARFFLPVRTRPAPPHSDSCSLVHDSPSRNAGHTSGRRGIKRSQAQVEDDDTCASPRSLQYGPRRRRQRERGVVARSTRDALSDSHSESDDEGQHSHQDPFLSSPLPPAAVLREKAFGRPAAHTNAINQLPLALTGLSIQQDAGSALMRIRSGMPRSALFGAGRNCVPRTSYLDSFVTTAEFTLDPVEPEQGPELPLCGAFSYSARYPSSNSSRWLASGTNSGTLVLVDCAEGSAPQKQLAWNAHRGSTFDLAWREDDRRLLSGGSDYYVKIWDAETGLCTGTFAGHTGSPRSVAWDPTSTSGSLFSSAGRDGSVLVYDARVHEAANGQASQPVLRIDCAHPSSASLKRGKGTRSSIAAKGVMSLTYLPTRGQHTVASAGCADGVVKVWDLRQVGEGSAVVEADVGKRPVLGDLTNVPPASMRARGKKRKGDARREEEMCPAESSIDVSARQQGSVKSSHGISSLVASSTDLFAASTDGHIHALSIASLAGGSSTISMRGVSSFAHPSHKGNTLYARLALAPDQRTLALGCRNGDVTLWDVKAALNQRVHCAAPSVLRSQPTTTMMTTMHHRAIDGAEINAVAFMNDRQDGHALATLADDYAVRLWAPRRHALQ